MLDVANSISILYSEFDKRKTSATELRQKITSEYDDTIASSYQATLNKVEAVKGGEL